MLTFGSESSIREREINCDKSPAQRGGRCGLTWWGWTVTVDVCERISNYCVHTYLPCFHRNFIIQIFLVATIYSGINAVYFYILKFVRVLSIFRTRSFSLGWLKTLWLLTLFTVRCEYLFVASISGWLVDSLTYIKYHFPHTGQWVLLIWKSRTSFHFTEHWGREENGFMPVSSCVCVSMCVCMCVWVCVCVCHTSMLQCHIVFVSLLFLLTNVCALLR